MVCLPFFSFFPPTGLPSAQMKNYERMVIRVSTANLLRVSLLASLLVESEVERQSLIVCRLVLKRLLTNCTNLLPLVFLLVANLEQ
jgi:hypothetical protein